MRGFRIFAAGLVTLFAILPPTGAAYASSSGHIQNQTGIQISDLGTERCLLVWDLFSPDAVELTTHVRAYPAVEILVELINRDGEVLLHDRGADVTLRWTGGANQAPLLVRISRVSLNCGVVVTTSCRFYSYDPNRSCEETFRMMSTH